MHPDTRLVAAHMKDFGLHVLGQALVDVTFAEILKPYSHAMGLVRCAHASELLFKARIAEEHPLLIFENIPKMNLAGDALLNVNALMDKGRTIIYSELPDALWAVSGYKIREINRYQHFGRLRNLISHFSIPDVDFATEVFRYIFDVIEPAVYEFWRLDIIDYAEQYDPDCYEYICERLEDEGISFSRRKDTSLPF